MSLTERYVNVCRKLTSL